ncbi:hydantoinase B/oxoprolinase family protein [Haloglomus litoreum]|uniref:hydantoinase B/oxoprolinase family protein n=1 Tax=Haloglomus litoreum TaxID=3034026 RepID=UPI0023E7BAA7|nr:hydantoinase B/oxoprolinase family protein [Haloglomus sp. DT116]
MSIENERVAGEKRRVREDGDEIGWDGRSLQEMLRETEALTEETGRYRGLERLEMKEESRFEYERLYSRLRGALVSARETALHVSASPIVREIGELCFQIYTPEGDSIAVSTGIIVHVHTGSLAIKWMIEQDYEHDRGIEPGDIFCNNDNDLGNVHTTDVHTIVPIFHDGELVAWADGVTHEIDIGGMSAGHTSPVHTRRFEDGIYATCEKVGKDDERFQDWKVRGERSTRTPQYWDLDEKCRIAGCHMIREAVHDIIDDVGAETFKQFTREAVEEGRQTMESRVQERLFPGTYQSTSFAAMPFEEEGWKPEQQRDHLIHLPVEMEVETDGTMSVDMEGASPQGDHSFNAAEGSMTGGLWVSMTQCLLHDGKVNDGSHIALDTNFPEGSITNPDDPQLSFHAPWGTIMPTFQSVWQNVSQGFFSRGFREEVVTGYSETSDTLQGGGTLMESMAQLIPDEVGDYYPIGPFDLSCQGLGASAVRDGLDWGYAMWNPESDMGDIEEWELTQWGTQYLSRQVKTDSAGHGKYRGGSGWEGVMTFMGNDEASLLKTAQPDVTFSVAGMSGGYPGSTKYAVRAHDTDLQARARQEEPYPVGDTPPGTFEEDIDGDIVRTERGTYFPKQFDNYDLVHFQMGGGPGWGDPLDRPVEKVVEDVEDQIFSPGTVEDVYGVVGEFDEDTLDFEIDEDATDEARERIRERRDAESMTYDEFFDQERQRVAEADVSDQVATMYEEVFDISEAFAEEFEAFWGTKGGLG